MHTSKQIVLGIFTPINTFNNRYSYAAFAICLHYLRFIVNLAYTSLRISHSVHFILLFSYNIILCQEFIQYTLIM